MSPCRREGRTKAIPGRVEYPWRVYTSRHSPSSVSGRGSFFGNSTSSVPLEMSPRFGVYDSSSGVSSYPRSGSLLTFYPTPWGWERDHTSPLRPPDKWTPTGTASRILSACVSTRDVRPNRYVAETTEEGRGGVVGDPSPGFTWSPLDQDDRTNHGGPYPGSSSLEKLVDGSFQLLVRPRRTGRYRRKLWSLSPSSPVPT